MDLDGVTWENRGEISVPTVHVSASDENGILKLHRTDGGYDTAHSAIIMGVKKKDAKELENGNSEVLQKYVKPNEDGVTYRIPSGFLFKLENDSGFGCNRGGVLEEFDRRSHAQN